MGRILHLYIGIISQKPILEYGNTLGFCKIAIAFSSKECLGIVNISFCKIDIAYSSKECVLVVNIGFHKIVIAFSSKE
jgi:hypothetical protein